jgi:hypothetical protein
VDGDHHPDVIAAFASEGEPITIFGKAPGQQHNESTKPGRWIEAISGRTGEVLWRQTLDDRGLSSFRFDKIVYAAALTRWGNRKTAVVVVDTRLAGFDVQTGAPVWPIHDLGEAPARARASAH